MNKPDAIMHIMYYAINLLARMQKKNWGQEHLILGLECVPRVIYKRSNPGHLYKGYIKCYRLPFFLLILGCSLSMSCYEKVIEIYMIYKDISIYQYISIILILELGTITDPIQTNTTHDKPKI